MKKWRQWFVGVIMVIIGALGAGCATTGDVAGVNSRVGIMEQRLSAAAADLSTKAGKAAVDQQFTAEQARTATALTSVVQTLELVRQRADNAATNAASAHSRINLAEQRLGRVDNQLADLRKADEVANRELATLRKGVAGARALASSAHKKTGIQSYLAGPGRFLVAGFPVCKFDKEGKLVAGAELSAAAKKIMDQAWWELQEPDQELGEVVGFADERPFKGQMSEKSEELNQACAQARAVTIRDYLEVGDIGDKLKVAGPTAEFGELSANRAGLVIVKKKP